MKYKIARLRAERRLLGVLTAAGDIFIGLYPVHFSGAAMTFPLDAGAGHTVYGCKIYDAGGNILLELTTAPTKMSLGDQITLILEID